jgi:hypothetical protein
MTAEHGGRRLRANGLLVAIPGLVAPVVLLALSIRLFAHEWHQYYAVPEAVRNDPDPGPIGADAGLDGATLAIAYALLLFLPPLLVALPRRLRLWMAILAIVLLLPAALVLVTFVADRTAWGAVALLALVYIVVLAVVRLLQQALRRPVAASAASPGS